MPRQMGIDCHMRRDAEFLKSHIRDIMGFYHPIAIDRQYGGYINQPPVAV